MDYYFTFMGLTKSKSTEKSRLTKSKSTKKSREEESPAFHNMHLKTFRQKDQLAEKDIRRTPPATGPPSIVFLGSRMSGCSSIIHRYNFGLYHKEYKPEPGNIRHTKDVIHPYYGCYVKIQFCDIMGGDFRAGLKMALMAHAVVVVYDITKRTTFELAQRFLENINPRASVMLIGNKVDCQDQRRVSFKEGKLLARIHRVEFIEVSAKSNFHIDESLNLLLMCIPDEYLFSKRKLQKLQSSDKLNTDEGVMWQQSP